MTSRAEREGVSAASAAEARQAKKTADDIMAAAVSASDVEELRGAVVTLAGRVTSLSEALVAVNEIQQRQSETERKTAAIQKDADKAKKTVETLVDTAATKTELHASKKEQEQVTLDFRKATLQRIYTTGILMVLGLALLVGGYIQHETSLSNTRAKECLGQQYSTRIIAQFVRSQIDIETQNKFIDDALRAKRIQSLTELGNAFPIPDCGDKKK